MQHRIVATRKNADLEIVKMILEKPRKVICPNCENEFDNEFAFCPYCGQKNKTLNLHLKHFLHDFLSGAFNIDSKFFLTFKTLVFYPGKLSKEFLSGKRTKYLPPVRIYLIVSLVYFTMLSFLSSDMVNINEDEKQLTQSETYATADSTDVSDYHNSVIADSVRQREVESNKQDDYSFLVTLNNLDALNDSAVDSLGSESTIEKGLDKTLKRLKTKEGKKAFSALFRKFTSIGMFILMPLTAFIFFLMFYKGTYYIQHLVFVLHLQSLIFILFVVFNLVELLIDNTFISMLNFSVFLFLLVIWIKNFYMVSWWHSIWKSIVFLFFYGLTFFVFLAVVVIISGWAL